jgi:hypothetical protein
MRILAGLLSLLFLFGCSSVSPEVENLMENHPEIKKEMETLPDSELSQVKLPSYLPFKPDSITSTVQKDAGFKPMYSEVLYHKEGNADLYVSTYFNRVEKIDPDLPTTFKLKDGSHADMRMDHVDTRELIWSDEQQKLTYKVTLVVIPQTNNPWTKDDMVKIAESMK